MPSPNPNTIPNPNQGSGVLFAVQCRGGYGAAPDGAAAAAAGGVAIGGWTEPRCGGGTSHPMEGAGGETENLVARAGDEIRRVCARMLRDAAERTMSP